MAGSKGRPFLEILASALNEDYRFPILEVFAFLYALGTFALASFVSSFSTSATGESLAYGLTSSILGLPLFIFIILIFKNVAYGLGNDVEKGIIQTFFSYPLKRRSILSAKLLSALGLTLGLFLCIQISALYVLAPGIVGPYLGTIILTYAANLSSPLFITGIILLVTLILKKGGLALIVGIVLFFALMIAGQLTISVAYATKSVLGLQIMSVFSPNVVLSMYYSAAGTSTFNTIWSPSFTEVIAYLGASYAIVLVVFLIGYLYFSRRMNL
jgi:ABC-type transport system involved in multi-copper enzyme maturation permease subunit